MMMMMIDEDTLLNACEVYEQQLTSGLTDNNDATENDWMNDDNDEDTLLNVCEVHDRQLTSGNMLDAENCWMIDDIDEDTLLNVCEVYERQLTSGNMTTTTMWSITDDKRTTSMTTLWRLLQAKFKDN